MKKFGLWLSLLGLASLSAAQETATQVKVTVDGYAYMGDTDTIQAAKERAMKDAERKAIEQGTGLYIESYSKVHNYMTVEDDIKSMATGYITSKKVLFDALESNPPRYRVQIEADVKCGDLGQLLTAKKEEESPQQQPLSFEYSMIFEAKTANGSWQQREIKDEDIVHVGDRLQVLIRPTHDCNLIMTMSNGKGKLVRLLPPQGQEVFKVQAGKQIRVPIQDPYLILDATDVGISSLLLFASSRPLTHFQWLIEKAEKSATEANLTALKNAVQSVQKRQIGNRRMLLANRLNRRTAQAGETIDGKGILIKGLRLQVQP